MRCAYCAHFDSPEWPPSRVMGSCRLDGCEPMPPDAEPCGEFVPSAWGARQMERAAIDAEWDERAARWEGEE